MLLLPDREQHYPNLRAQGYKVTSEETLNRKVRYNCVAWAATRDTETWWEDINAPGHYWPPGIANDGSLNSYIKVFESLGYRQCDDSRVEILYEKVALYCYPEGDFSHVSYQLYSGWTSKLGDWEDIWHKTLGGLEGDYYGQVALIMKRRCRLRGFLTRASLPLTSQLWPLTKKMRLRKASRITVLFT